MITRIINKKNKNIKNMFAVSLMAVVIFAHQRAFAEMGPLNDGYIESFTGKNINPNSEESKAHAYFLASYGKNNVILNDVWANHHNASAIYSPMPYTNGMGFSAGYIWKANESSYKESFYYVQPFYYIPYKFLALRIGLNFIAIAEGEGPGGLVLPAFEINVGRFDRFFVSASLLSEFFFGMASLNITYILDDKVSNVMLGRAYGDDGDYTGYIFKVDYNFYKKLLFHACCNANFERDLFGAKFGLGFVAW